MNFFCCCNSISFGSSFVCFKFFIECVVWCSGHKLTPFFSKASAELCNTIFTERPTNKQTNKENTKKLDQYQTEARGRKEGLFINTLNQNCSSDLFLQKCQHRLLLKSFVQPILNFFVLGTDHHFQIFGPHQFCFGRIKKTSAINRILIWALESSSFKLWQHFFEKKFWRERRWGDKNESLRSSSITINQLNLGEKKIFFLTPIAGGAKQQQQHHLTSSSASSFWLLLGKKNERKFFFLSRKEVV